MSEHLPKPYLYDTGGNDSFRARNDRPREAPGLSAGGLQVARQQVTLKPSTDRIIPQCKKAPPAVGGFDPLRYLSVGAIPAPGPGSHHFYEDFECDLELRYPVKTPGSC